MYNVGNQYYQIGNDWRYTITAASTLQTYQFAPAVAPAAPEPVDTASDNVRWLRKRVAEMRDLAFAA